jgi:hypothetical protein
MLKNGEFYQRCFRKIWRILLEMFQRKFGEFYQRCFRKNWRISAEMLKMANSTRDVSEKIWRIPAYMFFEVALFAVETRDSREKNSPFEKCIRSNTYEGKL